MPRRRQDGMEDDMNDRQDNKGLDRRRFLRSLGGASTAAVAAAASPIAATEAEAYDPGNDETAPATARPITSRRST